MSVTRLPDGRHRVRVYVGKDPITGKKRLVDLVRRTESEAKRAEAQIRQQYMLGAWVAPSKEKVSDFLQRWLRDDVAPNRRPSTYRRYDIVVRRYLIPHLGNVVLSQLSPSHVAAMLGRLHSEGKSDAARAYAYWILHHALEVAVQWGIVARNVCDAIRPPKWVEKVPTGLSVEQVHRFLEAARQHRLHALWILAIYTGLRRGELLGLMWEDVDWDQGRLVVRRAMEESGLFGPPKDKQQRAVPLADEALADLSRWRVEQEIERATFPNYQDMGFVFCRPDGRPYVGRTVWQMYKVVLRQAGLPPSVRMHDLRHTFASRSLAAGANVRAVSEILGHHDPGYTLRRYSHALAEDKAEAVRRLRQYLGGGEKVGT